MIEVEKKFIIIDEQEKVLIDGAEFLGEKKLTDTYYDDSNYSLTACDTWLRGRNGTFELKISMNASIEKRVSDQYRELETEKEILEYFNFDSSKTMSDFLNAKGFAPFCVITTTRRKYKKEGFNIDLDSMDFGYTLIEVESMTDDESNIPKIIENIIAFAKKYNIVSPNYIRGKVVEYLRVNNPAHFHALIDAKVIK